jgi:hypothetical protein
MRKERLRYPLEDRFLFLVVRLTGWSIDHAYRQPWVQLLRSFSARLAGSSVRRPR